MKKLLSLILTLALMATVFGTVAMAEEFSKTVKANDENTPIEMLWVTQDETTGAQTISSKTLWGSASNPTVYSKNWVLVKINVGQNLEFDTMKLTTRVQVNGSTKVYVAPLSYIDYEAAATAKANGTTLTTLVKPVSGGSNVAATTVSRTSNGTSSGSVTLSADLFNNSAYYHDGYVYLALTAADGTDTSPQLGIKAADKSHWALAISGTVVEAPAVDNFSDAEIGWNGETGTYTVTTATTTGTAMLIAASFDGTELVDAKVATVNAANAENGVITETIGTLEAGTVKIFLLDSTTLAPAIGVTTP